MDYALILRRKYVGAEWTLNGDDYSGLIWLSKTTKPTKTELDNLWETVQNEVSQEAQNKANEKTALLERLGITADEAALLLG